MQDPCPLLPCRSACATAGGVEGLPAKAPRLLLVQPESLPYQRSMVRNTAAQLAQPLRVPLGSKTTILNLSRYRTAPTVLRRLLHVCCKVPVANTSFLTTGTFLLFAALCRRLERAKARLAVTQCLCQLLTQAPLSRIGVAGY